MSYTPTSWTTGDTITASALNKIEQGIANAGSALICNVSNSGGDYVLDKTVQEIYNALISGTPVYALFQYGAVDTDYIGNTYLAPVVKIYNYDYTNVIRVCIQKPTTISGKGSYNYILSPSIALFFATGLNQYPQYYGTVYPGNSYVDVDGSLA